MNVLNSKWVSWSVALWMIVATQVQADFVLPESDLTVKGRVTLLAIDDHSMGQSDNLTMTLNKPTVRQAPVLTPERGDMNKPDSMASHFYGTVLYDQGTYRMWYYSVSLRAKPYDLKQGPVCYAVSDDGINWTKPNLGQVDINGSTNNNAVKLSDEMTQCAAVIIDEDEPNPMKRYKMVYMVLANTWVFRTATSGDGITWDVPDNHPTEKFLEMGSFFKFGDQYVVHGQGIGKNADGTPEGRQGYASFSTDFVNWDQDYKEAFRLPEPEDKTKRGLIGDYPQVHIGVGATSFGNVAVGLYGVWHNPPVDQRRKKGWYGAGLISCDLALLVSNDGVAFREPVKDFVYISGEESPVTPVPGILDPTILCQANGILNVGDETLIYHGRWRNATITGKDYYAEVALATLPRDRWGSLQVSEGQSVGTVMSAPITLPEGGCEIFVNAENIKGMRVQVCDVDGNPIEGYDGTVRRGKSLERSVKWSNSVLNDLEGITVRLKISMDNPRTKLYAVYLDEN